MEEVPEDVLVFLERVKPEKRRRDAEVMVQLMTWVTAEPPRLWGSMIGFGQYHYRAASGREGHAAAASFAPRKAATVIYLLDGIAAHQEQLERLGPHTSGVGCLHVSDLNSVDLSVLETIVAESYRSLTDNADPLRAREGGQPTAD